MQNVVTKLKELARGKSVALFGCGASTKAVKKLFDLADINCVFYDDKENIFDLQKAKNHGIAIYSPAFKPSHPFRKIAEECGILCVGEPDLAGILWQGKSIAITGTNGKTTLTSFLTLALNKSGRKAFACGNIGKPLCEFIADGISHDEIAVFEISSFQSMSLKFMKFDALIWTNFAPDHLDWHCDMQEYFDAKLHISNLLKSEIFLFGSGVKEASKEYKVELPKFAEFVDKNLCKDSPFPFDNSIQSENFALAKRLFEKLSIPTKFLYESASEFKLAKFRFAKTAQIDGITFWNDSKATNAHAAIAALNELKGNKVFWIGGGKNKYCDNSELCECVKKIAVGAALIGQTAPILKPELEGLKLGVFECETLQEAVRISYEKSPKGCNVLFSPAFSSFGMFKSYSDRGNCFDEAVNQILNEKIKK